MKLLIRHELEVNAAPDDDALTGITASFYRTSIDPSYSRLIAQAAEQAVFDCFILQCVRILLDKGKPTKFLL